MKPTRIRLLVAVAVISAALGWVVATIADSVAGRYLPVPWTAAVAVWLLALALGMWTWLARPRLLRKPHTEPLSPFLAARTAALALAASRVGAGVAGAYAGIGIVFLSDLQVVAAQQGAWVSGVSALGGLALAAVGLYLEHLCRIKGDDDEGGAGGKLELPGIAGTDRSTA